MMVAVAGGEDEAAGRVVAGRGRHAKRLVISINKIHYLRKSVLVIY